MRMMIFLAVVFLGVLARELIQTDGVVLALILYSIS